MSLNISAVATPLSVQQEEGEEKSDDSLSVSYSYGEDEVKDFSDYGDDYDNLPGQVPIAEMAATSKAVRTQSSSQLACRTLDLSCYRDLTPKQLRDLLKEGMYEVRDLRLPPDPDGKLQDVILEILANQTGLKRLRALDLSNRCYVTVEGLTELLFYLEELEELHFPVDVSDYDLPSRGDLLNALYMWLDAGKRNLCKLDLANQHVSADQLRRILPHLPNLTELSIEIPRSGQDDLVEVLIASLQEGSVSRNIRKLDFSARSRRQGAGRVCLSEEQLRSLHLLLPHLEELRLPSGNAVELSRSRPV